MASDAGDYVFGVTKEDRKLAQDKSSSSVYMKTKASEIAAKGSMTGRLVSVKDTDPVGLAFKLLIENQILSLPVQCTKGINNRKYVAFIDICDIVTHFMDVFGEDFQKPDWQTSADPMEWLRERATFAGETCGKVANKSGRNSFCPVQSDAPIRAVIDNLINENVHRVPIVNPDGTLVTVVTQSQLIKWLAVHLDPIQVFSDESIESLGLAKSAVITISSAEPTLNAFKLINDHRVSGVGVVDASGKLVGNISVSDMREIGYSARLFDKIQLPISQFIELIHQAHPDQPQAILSVTPTASLREVFQKILSSRVHRIYVVSPTDGSPIGIISLGDILSKISSALF